MKRCDSPTKADEARLRLHLPELPERDALLIDLGMETGLRTSELLRLTIADVWRAGAPVAVLKVERRNLKGGRGDYRRSVSGRGIPLNARARAAIERTMRERLGVSADAPLFPSRKAGRAITRRQVSRLIGAAFRAAGLDATRVWAGHSLRRRFARAVFDLTGNIELTRVALGHRWVTTTQEYVGLGERDADAIILQLGRV